MFRKEINYNKMKLKLLTYGFLFLGFFCAYNCVVLTYNCWENKFFYKKDMCFMINKDDYCYISGRGNDNCELYIHNRTICEKFPEFMEMPCYKMRLRKDDECTFFFSSDLLLEKKSELEWEICWECGKIVGLVWATLLFLTLFTRLVLRNGAKNETFKTKID